MNRLIILFLLYLTFTGCNDKTVASDHKLLSDTNSIKCCFDSIINTDNYRNYKNIETLNNVAQFIYNQFRNVSDSTNFQNYNYGNAEYKNVICSINPEKSERIIIGAHYDVCENTDGADDNASGVVGLIELAKLLKTYKGDYRIDLVAYSLEEPPFFRTEYMGSYVHAKYLKDNNINVYGMICLEMIGYFSDKENSQSYPVGMLSWFYGNKANFIMVAQKWFNGDFGNEFLYYMKSKNLLPTESFKAPESISAIDFSDHLNYWNFGYSAVMVTNTSFYRNNNYHEKSDKVSTLDIKRMALVIDEIYLSILELKK